MRPRTPAPVASCACQPCLCPGSARAASCADRIAGDDALQVIALQLQCDGVQALGELVTRGSVALGRAEKAGATGALLDLLESTVATLESDAEANTPSAALAPTALALVLRVLRSMAAAQRSVAVAICKRQTSVATVLRQCGSTRADVQEAAVALVAALAALQQCRQALSESGVFVALATVCLKRESGLECKGKCMTSISLVLEEVRLGRAEHMDGEREALAQCSAGALSVLRECEQAWSAPSRGAQMQVVNTVAQSACIAMGGIVQRSSALRLPVDPSISQELQSWVDALESRPRAAMRVLGESQNAAEAPSVPRASRTHSKEADSGARICGQILLQLKSCLAAVLNADKSQQSMAATDGAKSTHVHAKMRGVVELTVIVDKARHLPQAQCACEREGTTCAAVRCAAALELLRWAQMPGGLDALMRSRAAGSLGSATGVLAVVLKCLRLSISHSTPPSDLWITCAQLATRLVSAEAAVAQLVREDGMMVLLALSQHPHDLVKGSVLDIFVGLAATSKGRALTMRAPLGDIIVWGLKAEAHRNKSLQLLATWWQPGSVSHEGSTLQHTDLELVARALHECLQGGSRLVLGSVAMLLGNLLASPMASTSSSAPKLTVFVREVCGAMETCRLPEEVAALTRVLACASASVAGKSVLVASRDRICASVECAAGVCEDERIVDHALVLLRNMGTSDLDCIAFRARHLVRILRGTQPSRSLSEMVRTVRARAPCRSLSLLCHLISGHEVARKAVVAEQGHQVLLAFLCSRDPEAGGEHDVAAELARRMVATALTTAISKRMLDRLDSTADRAATALTTSALGTTTREPAAALAKGIKKSEISVVKSRGDKSKAAVQELVQLVQQFGGEHARALSQPQDSKHAVSSARAPWGARALSDQDRALAAQAMLQSSNDAAWIAAISSTKLVDVICTVAEVHMEQCVLSERPHLYKHEKVLALALMLLRRVICVAASSFPDLVSKLPLKRVLQGLVSASEDVVKPAARAYLIALSASEAGSLRMLKDGVANVLVELISKDKAFAGVTSVPFGVAALDYMSMLHNMCSTSTGEQAAQQLSSHPLLIQVLSKFMSKAADKVGCSMGASLLERMVACSSAAQRNCYTPCLLPLISLLRLSQLGPCMAALKTLKLLVGDTECLPTFVHHGGCGAVLLTCCNAVHKYKACALADKEAAGQPMPPPLNGSDQQQATVREDEESQDALAAAIRESANCLMKACSNEQSRVQMMHEQAAARLAEALAIVSTVPWAPPDMCVPLARSLIMLLAHAKTRQAFMAPHELHLSHLSNMLADASAPEASIAPVIADIRALLNACAHDLSGMMATLASVKSSMASLRRQNVLKEVASNGSASQVSNGMQQKRHAKDKQDRKVKRGKTRRGAGGKAVEAEMEALRTVVLQRLQSLIGTLTTLRVLSHLSPARQYVAKSEGQSVLTGLVLNLIHTLRTALDLLRPQLLDTIRFEALDCSARAFKATDQRPTPFERIVMCAWTCLSAVGNFAREEVYITRVLQHMHGTEVLRDALACRHACIASAAAVVVRQFSSSGNARHTLIGAGCVPALMARCSFAEPCLLRSAAVEALQALTSGAEAHWHVHNLRPLLTRETLLALGAACLTSTVQKLEDILVSLGTCHVDRAMTHLQEQRDALKLSLSLATSEVSDQLFACLESVASILDRRSGTQEAILRLQRALQPVQQGRFASLLTTSNQPAIVTGPDGQDKISATSWESMCAHTQTLLALAEVAENVEQEAAGLAQEHQHLCQRRQILDRHLKHSKQQQRAAERMVSASSANAKVSSLLETERQRMQAEQSWIPTLSGIDELIAEIQRYLSRILNALAQLRGISATRGYHDAAQQLLLQVEQMDNAHEDATNVGWSTPARLVRQQRLITALHAMGDDCKYHALGFIKCLFALDSSLAQHAASNG